MENQEEMVKVESWILFLGDWDGGNPKYYYNEKEDTFQNKFSTQCAFLSEDDCFKKEKELNLDGLQIAKGTFDLPKETMINSLMSVLEKADLVKRN